jgi:hypothetical protein
LSSLRGSRGQGIYALTIEDKLARYTVPGDNGCIEWIGTLNAKGYGTAGYEGKNWMAHRLMYTHFVGEIPEGMVIDHLCRNHACVNIEHLEVVTNEENLARGLPPWGSKPVTHCPSGHEYTEENSLPSKAGSKWCRICRQLQHLARYKPKKPSTIAKHAALYTELSTMGEIYEQLTSDATES